LWWAASRFEVCTHSNNPFYTPVKEPRKDRESNKQGERWFFGVNLFFGDSKIFVLT